MKGKLLLEFLVIATCFFTVWFALSQIDFINEDDIKKISRQGEKKLGELILEGLDHQTKDFDDSKTKPYIDSIARKICDANQIVFDSIKIHIIRSSEINAFALPDRHLPIYTELLEDAKSAEEVAGVIGHEIGHMEKDHIMKKLIKEIGISLIMIITGGGENLEVIKEAGRLLSSTAFDRSQEQEADDYAVEAMKAAKIDIEPFGNFLFRLSSSKDLPDELVWISTHPESKERAAAIFKKKQELTYKAEPVLSTPWDEVVKTVKDEQVEN